MSKAQRRARLWAIVAIIVGSAQFPVAQADEAVIIRCRKSCAAVIAAVEFAGGKVTYAYRNVAAVAATLPKAGLAAVATHTSGDAIQKDVAVRTPRPPFVEASGLVAAQRTNVRDRLVSADVQPLAYDLNLDFHNVRSLHASGHRGQGVVVAVIDSGVANAPGMTALSGSVIGGETFIADLDPLSATHRENGGHGTMAAVLIAAHATLLFENTSTLVGALNRYAPGNATPCTAMPDGCGLPPPVAAMTSAVPLTGTAPDARIYAMKAYSPYVALSSGFLAAMDRAITLRRNYNETGVNTVASGTGTEIDPFVYDSLNIDVVNMSFGWWTLNAGRDLADLLTDEMLEVGIIPTTAAGNEGFAAMLGLSPGTSRGALTVGAASTAVHERIWRDVQFGPGVGALFRPTTHVQTAWFSSRGPTADGRFDPDLLASGDWRFGQFYQAVTSTGEVVDCRAPGAVAGTCEPRIVFTWGTSWASPTVAGGAAVLRELHPDKSATQIRNALQQGANPRVVGDDSTRIDQGNGLLDVANAHKLLMQDRVSDRLPDLDDLGGKHDDEDDELGAGGSSVLRNVARLGLRIAEFRNDRYSVHLPGLKPGQVSHIFVPSDALTSRLTVTFDQVTSSLPPAEQNVLFGDFIAAHIVDAPTTFHVARAFAIVAGGTTHVQPVANPQTGLVRVAVTGAFTNAGDVSARVTITRERRFDAPPTALSIIEQDELDVIEFDVPAGVARGVFELAWKQNWGRYPTNDIDLILLDPAGGFINAATLDSPERAEVANPVSGRWRALIHGFTVHGLHGQAGHDDDDDAHRKDIYTFRAEADGKRLKQIR